MSKTKQDILCDNGLIDTRLNNPRVHKAMDEYADQVLSEYKEKLIARIRTHITMAQQRGYSDMSVGRVDGYETIISQIQTVEL